MANRLLWVSAAICVAASYGAYHEHAKYDPSAEAAKRRAVYEATARGDAADALKRCQEASSSDDACNRTYGETLRAGRSWYSEHGGAYNVVSATGDRNPYLFVALISGCVAFFQLRRKWHASDSAIVAPGRSTEPLRSQRGMSAREAPSLVRTSETAFTTPLAVQSETAATATEHPGIDADSVTSPPAHTDAANIGDNAAADLIKSAGKPHVRRAFMRAMKEVDTNSSIPELWAMALKECNGDERAARLTYMKVRATDIAWADAKNFELAQKAARPQEGGASRLRSDREHEATLNRPFPKLELSVSRWDLFRAVREATPSRVIDLCSLRPDFSRLRDSEGRTLMHIAVEEHRMSIVRVLLDLGADLSAKSNDGATPLEVALRVREPQIASELQKHLQ